jgi:hypothetical protein
VCSSIYKEIAGIRCQLLFLATSGSCSRLGTKMGTLFQPSFFVRSLFMLDRFPALFFRPFPTLNEEASEKTVSI